MTPHSSLQGPRLLPADPKAGYLDQKAEIDEAIRKVLDSGSYILGSEVRAFEEEFSKFVGSARAIGVGSCTDGLHLALKACGIGAGDVVITASHTAVATVAAIQLAGADPLLVDVDAASLTLDPNHLESAIIQQRSCGTRLKAVVPVHLYGHPCDMAAIMDLAQRHDVRVIEDCAQSHGAAVDGKTTGTWGDFGAFSFYPTKNLAAFGDGGALVTSDPKLAANAQVLREYGWRERYISELPGMNTRLDELQAAILRVRLRYLDRNNKRRAEIASRYADMLSRTSLVIPSIRPGATHVYHQYVVRHTDRDDLRRFLREEGIVAQILYPLPVHLQPAYQGHIAIGPGGLDNSESVCREILCIPIHPYLSDDQVSRIGSTIRQWEDSRVPEHFRRGAAGA